VHGSGNAASALNDSVSAASFLSLSLYLSLSLSLSFFLSFFLSLSLSLSLVLSLYKLSLSPSQQQALAAAADLPSLTPNPFNPG
jgi:hypothetical protein